MAFEKHLLRERIKNAEKTSILYCFAPEFESVELSGYKSDGIQRGEAVAHAWRWFFIFGIRRNLKTLLGRLTAMAKTATAKLKTLVADRENLKIKTLKMTFDSAGRLIKANPVAECQRMTQIDSKLVEKSASKISEWACRKLLRRQ